MSNYALLDVEGTISVIGRVCAAEGSEDVLLQLRTEKRNERGCVVVGPGISNGTHAEVGIVSKNSHWRHTAVVENSAFLRCPPLVV